MTLEPRLNVKSAADWAALIAAAGVAGMVVFQILLAVGLPLGRAAFGGANPVLPAKLRAASAMSALLFLTAFYAILARGGFITTASESTPVRIGIWVFAAIFGFSTLVNAASHSRWERLLMAPIGFALTACCVIVALA